MPALNKRIIQYLKRTNHRKNIDKIQSKYIYLYKGIVIDIGGRDRGGFSKPKGNVKQWIFADIEKKHNPDIVLNVENMCEVEDESVDVVNAIELFEHVYELDKAIYECYRILKPSGLLIVTTPFLYPVHADPYDFQRWTIDKWKRKLNEVGFIIEKTEIIGRFFSIFIDMLKALIISFPMIFRILGYLFFPFFDLVSKLDNTKWIKQHSKLSNYHGGYLLLARKNTINN